MAVIFEIDAENRRHLGDIGHPVGDKQVDWEKTQCQPVHNGLVIELPSTAYGPAESAPFPINC